jgi:hypothetical protein
MRLLNLEQFLKHSFLFIVVLSFGYSAMAQTAAKTESKSSGGGAVKGAQSYIDGFFKRYKASPDSAIDYIFNTNKLFAKNSSQITVLKMKVDSLQLSLGKYTGKELISERSASPSLVIYSYLVKHENQPIRFTFIFYKALNDWALYRFNFDDSMDQEMFEAVKINNKR